MDKDTWETMVPKNYRDSRNSTEPRGQRYPRDDGPKELSRQQEQQRTPWTKIPQRRWSQRTIEIAGTVKNPVDKDTSETMVPKNYRDSRNSKEPRGQRYLRDDGPKELSRQQEQHRTPCTKIPQRRWSQRTIRDSRNSKEHHGHGSQTSGSASPKELSHIAGRDNEEHVDTVQRDGGRQTGSRMSELKLGSGHIYIYIYI